jgi:hypothetical protein
MSPRARLSCVAAPQGTAPLSPKPEVESPDTKQFPRYRVIARRACCFGSAWVDDIAAGSARAHRVVTKVTGLRYLSTVLIQRPNRASIGY